ncbi:MAG: hypothetical protein M3R51_01785 [Candidatus Eremiobacteraeota bacterium]|nr:hypothetical protein [Candidatus Eremiobacteraeota bacterium]
MIPTPAFVAERHALLRLRISALLEAKSRGTETLQAALTSFIEAVEAHLMLDIHFGRRLLRRERDAARRAKIVEMLEEQGRFSIHFDTFSRKWRRAEGDALGGQAFVDDVESMVALLMHRIKTEQRIAALVANIA